MVGRFLPERTEFYINKMHGNVSHLMVKYVVPEKTMFHHSFEYFV